MLIRLSAQNFLSFNEKKEFNMFANNRLDRRKNDLFELDKSNNVLNITALYGANASGKSNFLQVLSFMKHMITKGLNNATKDLFCRTDASNKDKVTKIEIEVLVNGTIFAYGFEVLLREKTVVKEWLYELDYDRKTQALLFGKYINDNGEVEIELNAGNKVSSEDMIYTSTFEAKAKVNKSETFLKIINDESNMFSSAFNERFYSIRKWFEDTLEIIKPNSRYRANKINELHLKKISSIIQEFDTGISDITLSMVPIEEVKKLIPSELLEDIVDDSKKIDGEVEEKTSFTISIGPYYYIIEIEKGEISSVRELKFKHHGKECEFKYFEESDGTKRLFDILDMLLSSGGKVFVVDELERSLHPRLTKRFVEMFLEKNSGKESQLIFTTHETFIMSLELFRQDEIWFVEKSDEGYSSVYSLNEYKERYDKKIDRAYLEGRYGAVPVFQNLEMEG